MAITQVRGSQIRDRAVVSVKIALANIIEELLATDAVTTIKVKDANITAAKLATDAVETLKIKDANVTEAKLATGAVTANKLGTGAVTSGKIDTGAIGGGAQFAATVAMNEKTISGTVTFSGNPIVPNTPTGDTSAVNKGWVDDAIEGVQGQLNGIANAFNYVGTLVGGAVETPTDLALLAGGKNSGDYYKVTTAGYFKVSAPVVEPLDPDIQTAFYANANDGLVWNLSGKLDIIDNTNSTVAGTSNFITVTGASNTGYTVDVASAFKTRVTTIETEATAGQTATGLEANGTLAAYSGTSYLNAAASIKAATILLDTRAKTNADNVGVIANLATTATNLVAAINEVRSSGPSVTFVREKPVGSIDGTNADFTLAHAPVAATLQVFLNGVLQELTDDYTLASSVISMLSAPFVADKVTAVYFKA